MKKTGTSYNQRFGFKDNHWQNTWEKVRKLRLGQDQNFDIYFCVIFDSYFQKKILEERTGTSLCVQSVLRFSCHFLIPDNSNH